MMGRFLTLSTDKNQNASDQDLKKTSLDDLARTSHVLDPNQMGKIEGGHTANQPNGDPLNSNDPQFDWKTTLGGYTPS
jgi:hypothetical protein